MSKDTRQIILDSAKQEFADYGLDGARVDRIAARARINKAMIYYHFHSKDELYQEIINHHIERIGQFLEDSMARGIDSESFFEMLAKFYNDMISTKDTFLPIMLREIASGHKRIKTALTQSLARQGRLVKVKKLIDDGIKDGRFRDVDSRQAIISFVGMNIFYLLMAPAINTVLEIKDEKKFRQRRPQEIVDLFLNGLKVR